MQLRDDFKDILVEVSEGALWITINREEKRNAFREETLDEIKEALLWTASSGSPTSRSRTSMPRSRS